MKIKKVVLYTNAFCMPCQWMKNWYKNNNITFTEKPIVDDIENYNEFQEVVKDLVVAGTPTSRIIFDNGEEEIVVGYQKQKLEKIFSIKE